MIGLKRCRYQDILLKIQIPVSNYEGYTVWELGFWTLLCEWLGIWRGWIPCPIYDSIKVGEQEFIGVTLTTNILLWSLWLSNWLGFVNSFTRPAFRKVCVWSRHFGCSLGSRSRFCGVWVINIWWTIFTFFRIYLLSIIVQTVMW